MEATTTLVKMCSVGDSVGFYVLGAVIMIIGIIVGAVIANTSR